MVPPWGASSCAMALSNLVLPKPLGPSTETRSPLDAEQLMTKKRSEYESEE